MPPTKSFQGAVFSVLVSTVLNYSVITAENGKPVDSDYKLLFGGNNTLGYINFRDGVKQTTTLFKHTNYTGFYINSVTYDAHSEIIFWTDTWSSGKVYRSSTSNAYPEMLVNLPDVNPHGIAFDWITGNIYLANLAFGNILACRSDLLNTCAVIFSEPLSQPLDISLCPNKGIMFWTDNGKHRRISRGSMDGVVIKHIVTTNIVYPHGITVDQGGGRIYWADSLLLRVETSNFDGSDRRIIKSSNRDFQDIDVYGNTLVFNSWYRGKIKSMNKFHGNDTLVVREDGYLKSVIGVALMSKENQPAYRTNPCKNNTRCSHICALAQANNSSGEYRCLCPEGMRLDNQERGGGTCVGSLVCTETSCSSSILQNFKFDDEISRKSDRLVIAFGNKVAITGFDMTILKIFQRIHLPQIGAIRDLAYNALNHSLILSDQNAIFEYQLENGELTNLMDKEEGRVVTAMDFDKGMHSLYRVDGELGTLEVMSLTTREKFVLLENMTNICDVLVIPEHRSLLVSRKGASGASDIYAYRVDDYGLTEAYVLQTNHDCFSLSYDEQGYLLLTGSGMSHPKSLNISEVLNGQGFEGDLEEVRISNFSNVGASAGLLKLEDSLYWIDPLSKELKHGKFSENAKDSETNSIRFLREDETLYESPPIFSLGVIKRRAATKVDISASYPETLNDSPTSAEQGMPVIITTSNKSPSNKTLFFAKESIPSNTTTSMEKAMSVKTSESSSVEFSTTDEAYISDNSSNSPPAAKALSFPNKHQESAGQQILSGIPDFHNRQVLYQPLFCNGCNLSVHYYHHNINQQDSPASNQYFN